MKNILTITQQDILPDTPKVATKNFTTREAARAVLLDGSGQVHLLNVGLHGYHKLPGGGIDDGEDIGRALERELLEEVGCKANLLAELGKVVEYRDYDNGGLKQISYCYLARQKGERVASALEEGELAEEMVATKAANIDDAIALLVSDQPNNLEGKFIQRRDIAILTAAKEFMR